MTSPFSVRGLTNCSTSAEFGVRTAVLALAVAATAVLAAAPQFTSGVNVVEVYAAVTDHAGQPVTGLTRDDFTVLEDGNPQAVSAFTEGDFPLSVALAVDRSFSMSGAELNEARSAASAFLQALRAEDQVMVVAVGSEVETVAPLSADRRAQQDAVMALKPWGTTGLYDAMILAIDAIQSAKGRRALVLLSDGDDRYSKASSSDALDRARRSDVMIYPIALGRSRPALFAELASLTGGRSFQPRQPGQLPEIMRGIANELRHQYLIGYTPSRPIVAGEPQWRSIAVRVKRTDVSVRARDGYLAK